MQVVINADMIIKTASLLGALGAIGTVVVWCVKFVDRQKRQDRGVAAMRREQTMICSEGLERTGLQWAGNRCPE